MTDPKKPKKPKRKPITPRSKVKQALGKLFLSSRERAFVMKRDNYSCQVCGAKMSKAKGREISVRVHHREGDAWEKVIDAVFEHLLVSPDKMVTLCPECHDSEHRKETQ